MGHLSWISSHISKENDVVIVRSELLKKSRLPIISPSPETVSQFVIPAKSRKAGREPGSRKSMNIPNFDWIPDLARLRRPRPE